MASADFIIKQGDTNAAYVDVITAANGNLVSLSGASVNFVMRALTATSTTTNAAATIISQPASQVSYQFTATDTAAAGTYMANWVVTFPSTFVQTYPIDGYIEITIEENLTTPGGARLVSLGEIKDYLNIPSSDRTRDAKLLKMLGELTPVVELITGPIVQRIIQNEAYDGTGPFISLRSRPVISVNSVTEYRGPIPYPLTQVPTPDVGTIYSYMFEPPGRIVRRTVGGGMTDFPRGLDSVIASYTAGYKTVPANVVGAVKELIRIHFQTTQQGRPRAGGSFAGEDTEPGTNILGFYVPHKVREMLQPNRRHPAIA